MIKIRKNIFPLNEFHIPSKNVETMDSEQLAAAGMFNRMVKEGRVRFEEVPCICGNDTFDLIASVDRHSISQKTVICTRCGLVQSNPRMAEDAYRDFYSSDLYRRCYEGEKFLDLAEAKYRGIYGAHIYEEVNKIKNVDAKTSVLEIGAGGGWNLVRFLKAGSAVTGIEYSPFLVEMGKRHGINMVQGQAESISGRYDVIILSHILEHMPDPINFLKTVTDHMADNGIVYIEVPNILNFSLAQLQNAHTYYFTPVTFGSTCVKAGLEVIVKGPAQGTHIFGILKKAAVRHDDEDVKSDYRMMRLKLQEVKTKYMLKDVINNITGKKTDRVSRAGKIMKVIYLVESLFCKRDYERFGIDIMKENGFQVEVWDFTPFLYPGTDRKVEVKDPVPFKGLRTFLSRKEAEDAISALKGDAFLVSIIFYNSKSFSLFKAMSKAGLRYAIFAANIIPHGDSEASISGTLKRVNNITLQKIRNRASLMMPFYMRGIKPAAFLLAGGGKSTGPFKHFPVSAHTRTLWMHTLDYDVFLKVKDMPADLNEKLGVFLDEDVCFHPEYIQTGQAPHSTADEYFVLLRRLFDSLRERYGVDIVIAAHPRSKYEDHGDFFGGRNVVRWKTAELVKGAGFVIAHSSTSINFAVLFKKPIIFVTTNDLENSPQGKLIKAMASHFNKRPINLNNGCNIDLEKELVVDQKAYADYMDLYIKKGSFDGRPFWQILADNLKAYQ